MQYAGIIKEDLAAAPGLSVSFFTQGCPHHCLNCQNPETWDFNGGKEFTPKVIDDICKALMAHGIQRNFCIMGGEPLCPENLFLTTLVIKEVKKRMPYIKIYVWTGYTYEELKSFSDYKIKYILNTIYYLIDGPYIDELRDITLPMRGSSNQRIIDLTSHKKYDTISVENIEKE